MTRVYALLIVAAALLALIGALWWAHEMHAAGVIEDAVLADRKAWQDKAAEQLRAEQARVRELETRAAMAQLENDYVQKLAEHRAAADAARLRADADSLRRTLAALRRGGGAPGEGAPALSLADAAPALAGAFSECSSRYEDVAGVADRLAIQVTGLQGYVRDVVGPVCVAGGQAE